MADRDEWPDDLDGLAKIHFDPDATPERRADAWRKMEPKIRSLARRILQKGFLGIRRPLRDDLLEESPNDVALRHLAYDSTRSYTAWCRVVLEHRFADAQKKKRPGPFPFLPADDQACYENQIPDREQSPLRRFFDSTFPEADLKLLGTWEPNVRTVFLVKTGFWTKLPPCQRGEWLGGLALNQLADAGDGTLALACGMTLAEFRNTWSRCHHRCYLLQALTELIAFPEPGPGFFPQLYAEARRRYRCLDGQTAIEFPPEEMRILGRRRPREKLPRNMLLLSVSGLYPRVPGEPWNQWVDGDGLKRPFPPGGFRTDQDEQGKLEQLAPVFGRTVGWLSTRWTQYCRNLLEDLWSISTLIIFHRTATGRA